MKGPGETVANPRLPAPPDGAKPTGRSGPGPASTPGGWRKAPAKRRTADREEGERP